jgi:hypothetical protein
MSIRELGIKGDSERELVAKRIHLIFYMRKIIKSTFLSIYSKVLVYFMI